MNASKSAQLLMVAHNYEFTGREVIIFTPNISNRFSDDCCTKIESRIGLSHHAYEISQDMNILLFFEAQDIENIDCILVDESQFLTKEQIYQLSEIVDKYDIPVICYGLLKGFQGTLFEGSQALIQWADKIEEIKTVCNYCNKKATHVLRFENGKPVKEGKQIQIGDNEYISVCRRHWKEKLSL